MFSTNSLSHPAYRCIQPVLEHFSIYSEWPSVESYNQLIGLDVYRLIDAATTPMAEQYETIIYKHLTIPTRANNWHDFFNACTWATFFETKRALNKMQYQDAQLTQTKKRTARQNLLAHFDEDGLIVVYQSEALLELLLNHAWQALFYENMDQLENQMQFYCFGHGLLEKCLAPYKGLTAKAILLAVDSDFFDLSFSEQIKDIDQSVARLVQDDARICDKYRLQPIPVLGIPGWSTQQSSQFYQDQQYFRPKPKQAKPVIRN